METLDIYLEKEEIQYVHLILNETTVVLGKR